MELTYLEIVGAVVKLSRKVGANGEGGAAPRDPPTASVSLWLNPTGGQLIGVFEMHRLLCDVERIRERAKNGPGGNKPRPDRTCQQKPQY